MDDPELGCVTAIGLFIFGVAMLFLAPVIIMWLSGPVGRGLGIDLSPTYWQAMAIYFLAQLLSYHPSASVNR